MLAGPSLCLSRTANPVTVEDGSLHALNTIVLKSMPIYKENGRQCLGLG